MQDLLIKNGKVLIYKNNDVILEEKDILIQNGKIATIDKNIDINRISTKQSENEKKEHELVQTIKKMDQNEHTQTIHEINKGKEKNKIKIIDATHHIVMPGLINTHAHIPMSIFRETTEGCKLYEWLQDKIWPVEDQLTQEDVYWASMLSYIEMISTGTTCINDQYFLQDAIRKAAEDMGVRVVLTRPVIGEKEEAEKRIAEFRKFYETRDKGNELITYTVAPHSLYTCSTETLQMTADLAKELNLAIHVHFLESVDEIEDIKQKHGEKASKVLKKYFDGIHTILAHAVHLDDEDVAILKTMDCGIAHNPVSNLRLGCTIADTTKYLQNNLNVALRNRWTRLRQ